MKLVRIVSNDMDENFVRRCTPKGSKVWGNCKFTTEPISECDYCIFLNNNNRETINVICPPENIWMLVQEPYQRGLNDWVKERHQYFGKVFTHLPMANSSKYIPSQTCLPWHIGKTYDELVAEIFPPPKEKVLSAIIGNAAFLPGHKKRNEFVQKVKVSNLDIDLFGRGIRPVKDKLEGLENYMFSFAIENNSNPDMWTEKLADCYLSWTMPIYYGCTNLEKYFPKESFIQIDLDSPEDSINLLKKCLSYETWSDSLDAIRKARSCIIEKYHLFPFIVERIATHKTNSVPENIKIPNYRRSLKAKLSRVLYKISTSCNKRF